jgi:hypothetical protein
MLGGGSMIPKKKLQVFVSSTYVDLKEERQAAVEAILIAGHIPAGMELFAAGDQSQMEVIKRWIDESDVFLLILGGRYGSLEPNSKKSYIELEYDYAQEKRKPSFAVVINDQHLEEKIKTHGRGVIETESPKELKRFREIVLSRMSKFWSDPRDIKLAILETLSEFGRREDMVGWIPGNESIDVGALAEEIARLGKENAILRERLSKTLDATFCGLTFDQMYQMLLDEPIDLDLSPEWQSAMKDSLRFNTSKPGLLDFLWFFRDALASGSGFAKMEGDKAWSDLDRLHGFGLVEVLRTTAAGAVVDTLWYRLTDEGKRFLLRLRAKAKAEDELSRPDPANGIVGDPPATTGT